MNRHAELVELVTKYRRPLHSLAYRFVKNAADAEDVVQDALLLAFTNLGQFRGNSKLSTWLFRIVINCAKMRLRRAVYAHPDSEELLPGLVSPALGPDETLHRDIVAVRVQGAVNRLSPVLRVPLELYLSGHSLDEIARTLGRPLGTVKSSLSRARRHLQRNRTLRACA